MSDRPDYDRDDRPSTAQPPPVPVPGAPSVHDLVVADLDARRFPRDAREALSALLAERRAFGLAKYGTVLQVEDPARDARHDLLEELGDALVYAYRAKATTGSPLAHTVYDQLLALTAAAAIAWHPAPAGRA